MKFIYTEAALQELQMFQKHQQMLLEELIAERKFVYGDDNIEVTASDIKEASIFIRAYRPSKAKYSQIRLISQIYVFFGVIITLAAFFYPTFKMILRENLVQAVALITGIMMTLIGILMNYRYRLRIRQNEENMMLWYKDRSSSFHNDKDHIQ